MIMKSLLLTALITTSVFSPMRSLPQNTSQEPTIADAMNRDKNGTAPDVASSLATQFRMENHVRSQPMKQTRKPGFCFWASVKRADRQQLPLFVKLSGDCSVA